MIAGRLATTTPAPGAKGSRPDRSVPLGSARRPARPSAKGAAKVEFVPKSPEGRLAVATLFRSLVHPGRLGLLGFIASGERSGTQCVAHLGLAQGRASAHLARIVQCGLVSQRRAGRRVYYEIADRRVLDLLALGQVMVTDQHRSGGRVASPR
jgi:DNA-binding transcriptional ArsR family regulator